MFTTDMPSKLLIPAGSSLARLTPVEVGKQLFEARQTRGLTLESISHSTKIPVSLLRAIECDDASRLPQGFFTRAFVRAYANEVGLNADELLDSGELGEVEEVAVAPPTEQVPIQESSSSRSFFVVLALAAVCAIYYSGFGSHATPAEVPAVTVTAPIQRLQPVAVAPPCTPVEPAVTPVRSIRRTLAVAPSTTTDSPTQIETVSAGEPSTPISDAVLPETNPTPPPVPVDQF